MLNPLAILDQVRAARDLRPKLATPSGQARPADTLGAPPHLVPGKVVLDPVTGQEGEVLAYGRAHTIAPAAPGGGA
jgi:hypothetical protein